MLVITMQLVQMSSEWGRKQLEFCLTAQEEVHKKLVERLENLEAAGDSWENI